MRKILSILILMLIGLSAYTEAKYPADPSKYDKHDFTLDPSLMLSAKDEEEINGKLLQLRDNTGVEMAVVIIPDMNGEDIATYSVGLFNEWGIGDKELNNGLLLLVCMGTREVRLTTGIGMEKQLPSSRVKSLIDDKFIPAMRQGNLAKGIEDMIDAIYKIVK